MGDDEHRERLAGGDGDPPRGPTPMHEIPRRSVGEQSSSLMTPGREVRLPGGCLHRLLEVGEPGALCRSRIMSFSWRRTRSGRMTDTRIRP